MESHTLDEVDPDTPYAELWIGTHPKGPSTLKTGESLRDAIGEDLPFLFKVLSAGKALSIQAHPDKENAQRLHLENPQNYGDPNHKPEMAIALTPFEAMCGFRRMEEISYLIKKHPEFAACISQEAKLEVFLAQEHLAQKRALQMLFSSFMNCDPEVSSRQLKLLLFRLQAEQSQLHPHPHDEPAWCVHVCLMYYKLFFFKSQVDNHHKKQEEEKLNTSLTDTRFGNGVLWNFNDCSDLFTHD